MHEFYPSNVIHKTKINFGKTNYSANQIWMSTIALVRIGAMIGKRGIWKDRRIKVDGRYKYTLEQLTSPFEISFLYVREDNKPLFSFYAAEYKPSDELITESAEDYIKYFDNL